MMWMLLMVVMAGRAFGEEVTEDARGRSCEPFNRVDERMDKLEEILGPMTSYLNYCPELDTIAHLPDHSHSYGGGRREGYEVHLLCNEGFVACGSARAICGKDGLWSVEGDMVCIDVGDTIWANVVADTVYSLPCVPSIGTKIVLTGKTKWGESMSFDILDSDDNILFHNGVRMANYAHVIDSRINGSWKGSIFVNFNLNAGVEFVLEVEWMESGFQLTVDGEVKYTEYPYSGGVAVGWRMRLSWEAASVTYMIPEKE